MNPALVRNHAVVVALLGSLAGCSERITDPPIQDPPTLTPATQWAGGVVRLEWDRIDGAGPAPGLRIDGESLSARASAAGWAEYRLPTTASGIVEIELSGEEPDTFEVEVLGFRSTTPLDVNLDGNLLVWPRVGQASVVGAPGDWWGIVQVLPGAGTWSYIVEDSFAIDNNQVRGVGPTHQADRLLLPTRIPVSFGSGWMDVAGIWTVGSGAEAIDTLQGQFSRHAMLLSDSVLISTFHHEIWAVDPRTGAMLDQGVYEESRGVVMSPDGRYGAIRVAGVDGPPVFSGVTGQIVFDVDSITRSYGVDFSPGSDTLYVAGNGVADWRRQLLLAVDVTSGEVLSVLDLGNRRAINLARDPDGPWLFVPVFEFANGALNDLSAMLVVDTRTLQIVGELTVPQCTDCFEGVVAIDETGVYFVATGEPARVVAFDGWPAD